MKIVYFSPHPNLNLSALSGPGTHMREVIAGFRSQGHEVVTCIMGGEKIGNASIPTQSISFKSKIKKWIPGIIWQTLKDFQLIKFDKYAFKTLEEIVRKVKPDLIYERSYYLMQSGDEVAKKYSIKYFLEVNAPFIEEKKSMEGKSFLTSRASKIERIKNRSADRIVTVSSALKNHLINEYDCHEEKVFMIPNAVNPSNVDIDKSVVNKLMEKLNISSTATVLGFVGSIFPYHGLDRLIKGFDIVRNKLNDREIHLLIVGDGETLPELKSYALNNQIQNIKFKGNIPHKEVYQYIDLMDITIMAKSNWYGSPVKIFEYGIMKKPIIAPDTVPVRDVIKDGVDGVIVKDNLEDFVSKLENLINDKDYRDKIASNFYRKVQAEYTWQQVAVKTLNNI